MLVLGIETSCDDTSLALFTRGRGVIGNLTAAQLIHDTYGGVVPELASRAHTKQLLPVYRELLERCSVTPSDIDGIGVSNGPGLVGSLLVGVAFAKALAMGLQRPLVGVHHIEAHVLSNELDGQPLRMPALVLVVSGGHTVLYHVARTGAYELVGATRDDAAGESFDKIAKLLGLGFPGGPFIQQWAEKGDAHAVAFPRAMMRKHDYDFSFSGLKTAVRLYVERAEQAGELGDAAVADIAASAQEAIVDVLVSKTVACAKARGVEHVYLAGGVAANAELRQRMQAAATAAGLAYHAPLLEYCMDNGAMVACAAAYHLERGADDTLSLDVFARGIIPSWS